MGCFGNCNCGPCCMDAAELAGIASSIDIDWYAVDFTEGDPPVDSVTGLEFVSNGCCHTAPWVRGECCDYSYTCKKSLEYVAEESITISSKIIKSKKHQLSPAATVGATVEGFCVLIYDEPQVSAEDVCDEVYNCGTVTKTIEYKEIIHDAVGYDFNEIRVSIYKRNMICDYGGSVECKYVVEVAQAVDVILLGDLYWSFKREKTVSDVHECCQEIANCLDEKDHDPLPTCDDVATWQSGAPAKYWIVKYKTFDSADDITGEIVFEASDIGWPCGRIDFCGPDAGTPEGRIAEGELCFEFIFTVPELEGGQILQVAFFYSCTFCLDTGVLCDNAGGFLYGQPCSSAEFPCLCDHPGFSNRNLSYRDLAMDPIPETFQTVNNTLWVGANGCFELIYPGVNPNWPNECEECELAREQTGQVSQPAVPESERNSCNWWDCADCLDTGFDPTVAPYQFKMDTVDSYSFSQNTTTLDQSLICIPFRRTVVTINP